MKRKAHFQRIMLRADFIAAVVQPVGPPRPMLISFADDGAVLRSPNLTAAGAAALNLDAAPPLSALTDLHRANLARHRQRSGFDSISQAPGPA